jgi:hypothetical protein
MMLLEYLSDGSPDCPLIRLYQFTTEEVVELRSAVVELAIEQTREIAVHELPYVKALAGCQLTLCVSSFDQSVLQVDACSFECRFTEETWANIAFLIESFAKGNVGSQWMADNTPALLLSWTGEW